MSSAEPPADSSTVEVKPEEDAADEGDATVTVSTGPAHLSKQDLERLEAVLKRLSNYKDEEGRELSGPFQRLLNKRNVPAYFEVIKEPMAFSTMRAKLSKKQYQKASEFVRDFTRMCHNAMVFNRPTSEIYQDAVTLQDLFKEELKKLVEEKFLTEEEAALPDLGEIPPFDPNEAPEPDEEEDEEEEEEEEAEAEEEDEDEEEDVTDDDRPRGRRGKKARRSSTSNKRDGKVDVGDKDDPEEQKKRGRPPKVLTPMEARINTLLKGLRKFKDSGGELKIRHFEKLPDKSLLPDYYQEIKNPIAMDLIKRKAKRKKYQSVDQVLKDLDLMFDNAKSYNLENSAVYRDAVDLQKEARAIADQEKAKPDSDFADEDGRLPLPEILYNNETWKVGDWIHLSNPNDVTKPIVAQIYRTWQDPTGQKWINAVWYYRPEQTVHRYEKFFFENEVVKTGQYRDHKIEEVVDRCFVMFFTRYNKGRPRGFPADKEVYVCEARYNEEKHKLNKIKTWASCLPDEVREKDYEMDLFDVPRKMKKVPSPIKHLLREDAKEDDPLPKPTWGVPNAPPIVGAVHRRPREANESPPPEPTPSPQPTPEPVRRSLTTDRPQYDSQGDVNMSNTRSSAPLQSPMANQTPAQPSYGQQFAAPRPSPSPAPLVQQHSYGAQNSNSHSGPPYTPGYQPQPNYNQYGSAQTPPAAHNQGSLNTYNLYQSSGAAAPVRSVAPVQGGHGSTNQYNPPRPVEVYTLADSANAAIPHEIRSQFQTDEYGKVLFFTAPPVDVKSLPEEVTEVSHSLRYLADKARSKEADDKKRKAREAELEAQAKDKVKRMKEASGAQKAWLANQELRVITSWQSMMDEGTDKIWKEMYGDEWKEKRDSYMANMAVSQEAAVKRKMELEEWHKALQNRNEVPLMGFRF